ncbi:protein of unknown function DUF447 [Thiorhodococcus drewsii AZ1]|uniref:Tetrahydromethanopterin synthesis protein n=1 Tax=Thiorhodococcus drewsii AZ1 TaxID=765913 RepID=G2DX22_9GAMM|nr:DUF447 domain-containing protein [Thiorhodococcus drewsii]EGV33376.1 protein of unknown function DUF447 [Thiorhodococcus drewsii AZ1]
MIQEVIVTTIDPLGETHIAPMGIRRREDFLVISPFRPSRTLENLLQTRHATVNYTDDVRVFAGCLTGRRDWPLMDSTRIDVPRLRDALAHTELELLDLEEDEIRPRLLCRVLHEETHRPFQGFNRAQSAVLELAILVSRLERLPFQKVVEEMAYLLTAVEKTAGPREQEAWNWLMDHVTKRKALMEAGT